MGQECLRLQEQMRGGVLGGGHSWVASPAAAVGSSGGESSADASTTADGAAPDPSAEAAPSLLYRLADRLYNSVEDARDALAQDALHLRASAGTLLSSAVAAATAALLLRYAWASSSGWQ